VNFYNPNSGEADTRPVAKQPGILRNSVNNPLFLLCFAVGNPHASDVALRIANSLLRDLV